MTPKVITVHDTMQQGYRYVCTETYSENLAADFEPESTPESAPLGSEYSAVRTCGTAGRNF